ncbi:hypothetical protein ACHAXR_007123 [Thalassiosira sp. AJA248-18]
MLVHLMLNLMVFFSNCICAAWAQQSAAGQDTLIGIVGSDFVMMGADSSSSGGGGIALTSSNIDKIAVIHDGKGLLNGDRMCHDPSAECLEQQAIAVGFAGDAADADRLVGMLKSHAQIREYEAGIGNDALCVFDGKIEPSTPTAVIGALSPAGLDAEAIANLSRNQIANRMRSRQPLQLCLLVGGMVRCNNPGRTLPEVEVVDRVQKQISAGSAEYKSESNNQPTNECQSPNLAINRSRSPNNSRSPALSRHDQKTSNPFLAPQLFWLDQYGSLQNMRYAAHGHGSNFAYSVLDQRYRKDMSRQEAMDLIQECFEQLRQRYVINSPRPPRIKCIDSFGVTNVMDDTMKH